MYSSSKRNPRVIAILYYVFRAEYHSLSKNYIILYEQTKPIIFEIFKIYIYEETSLYDLSVAQNREISEIVKIAHGFG